MPIDTIDLTDLRKRGLLKQAAEEKPETTDYVDFSSPETTQPQQTESSNPLGFLDTFAANASTTSSQPAEPSSGWMGGTLSNEQGKSQTDTQDLLVKIDNLEYKLERLTEKLALIESKLQNFKNKTT